MERFHFRANTVSVKSCNSFCPTVFRLVLLVFGLRLGPVDMYFLGEWYPMLRIEYKEHLEKISQNGSIIFSHQVWKMVSEKVGHYLSRKFMKNSFFNAIN